MFSAINDYISEYCKLDIIVSLGIIVFAAYKNLSNGDKIRS